MESIKKYAHILIILLSLIVQLSILLFFDSRSDDKSFIGDESSYHNLAVNLVKGNGYSHQTQEPYEKWYFREPGYPYFVASIYSISNLFSPLEYSNVVTNNLKLELYLLKIAQMLLMTLSLYIYYYLFIQFERRKLALISLLIIGVSANFLIFSTLILRETLVVFLFTLFIGCNYLFIKNGYKTIYTILNGIITGLLILTLQVHFVLVFFWFISLLIYFKDIKLVLKNFSVYIFVTILVLMPHLINVYNFYPDLRIAKTFGTSFTYELVGYTSTAMKYNRLGLISDNDFTEYKKEWTENSIAQFSKSFNGYYNSKTDSLKSLYESKVNHFNVIIKKFTNSFRKTFFLTKYGTIDGNNFISRFGIFNYLTFIFIPYLLIGIFGIIGSIFYLKKYYIYFIPFVLYISLFYFLGSEYRRMIIIYPYLVFFAVLLVSNRSEGYEKLKLLKFW